MWQGCAIGSGHLGGVHQDLGGHDRNVGFAEYEVEPARPASRRHRWSEAERLRIVAESYEPGVSVSVVALCNDMNANLLFTWRRTSASSLPKAPDLWPGHKLSTVRGAAPARHWRRKRIRLGR